MAHVIPALSFGAFVTWLLAIAMNGPLLSAIGLPETTPFFLPPHIISLSLIGIFCPARLFDKFSPALCVLTVLLTLALPLGGVSAGPCLLALMGIGGAFVAISACMSLRKSPAPLASAACGLIIANLLAIPLMAWPKGGFWEFAVIAAPLLSIPVIARRPSEARHDPDAVSRWHYLPFILIFHMVSGLMYSFIMPVYQPAAYLPGSEIPFYIVAVGAALLLARKNLDLTLVCGVVLGMAAFSLLQHQDMRLMINMSMFAMQASVGFIDLALLALLLGFANPIRAFGIGLGTVCLGIFTGKILASSLANLAEPIVVTGQLVLNLSILTLYVLGRFHYRPRTPAAENVTGRDPLPVRTPGGSSPDIGSEAHVSVGLIPSGIPEESMPRMPENIRLLLSDREHLVLTETLDGKSFRQIAEALSISDSTVKTYMRRIYEKMGVKGKKELFEMLSRR